MCKNEVFAWEWCNFFTFRVYPSKVRDRIEISRSWALKIEVFRVDVGLQTSKNEVPEGIKKNAKKEGAGIRTKSHSRPLTSSGTASPDPRGGGRGGVNPS